MPLGWPWSLDAPSRMLGALKRVLGTSTRVLHIHIEKYNLIWTSHNPILTIQDNNNYALLFTCHKYTVHTIFFKIYFRNLCPKS